MRPDCALIEDGDGVVVIITDVTAVSTDGDPGANGEDVCERLAPPEVRVAAGMKAVIATGTKHHLAGTTERLAPPRERDLARGRAGIVAQTYRHVVERQSIPDRDTGVVVCLQIEVRTHRHPVESTAGRREQQPSTSRGLVTTSCDRASGEVPVSGRAIERERPARVVERAGKVHRATRVAERTERRHTQ